MWRTLQLGELLREPVEFRREERYVRSLTLGQDHDLWHWKAPGPLQHTGILEGGEIELGADPYRIAVDYTHAFSYDNGPETPRSPEYLQLCEENERKSLERGPQPSWSEATVKETVRHLPAEYRKRFGTRYWQNSMERVDGDIWVTVSTYSKEGFMELFQLAA